MSQEESIIVCKSSQNNLKDITVEIPKKKMTVITGVSGSGKSSLAFDTIYAEGYRRYAENLSAQARFFLQGVKKPAVDEIKNLPPAIAIDQVKDRSNVRSTVGTVSGVHDFFRSLFASFGIPYCPECQIPLVKADEKIIIDKLRKKEKGVKFEILAKWNGVDTSLSHKLTSIASLGYSKIFSSGKFFEVSSLMPEQLASDAEIFILIDRIFHDPARFDKERILDSIFSATKISHGKAIILIGGGQEELIFSRDHRCSKCDFVLGEYSARNFSFNSPFGACECCGGLGQIYEADFDKVFPFQNISIAEGAIAPWSKSGGRITKNSLNGKILEVLSRQLKIDLEIPIKKISKDKLEKIFYGVGQPILISFGHKVREVKFIGIKKELESKFKRSPKNLIGSEIEKYFKKVTCPDCLGQRLKKVFANFRFFNQTLPDLVSLEIIDLVKFFKHQIVFPSDFSDEKKELIKRIFDEIIGRSGSLIEVGLDYLSLDRSVVTLSGGEFQRVRLASQLHSGLSDVVYVLDEPSVGLHPRDTQKLIKILNLIKGKNNTLIVVEHDRDLILSADKIIDIGPGAGVAGGRVVFEGTVAQIKKQKTQTARQILGEDLELLKAGEKKPQFFLKIDKISKNNLKEVEFKLPLGLMTSLVGVSGSGKSSLSEVVSLLLKKALSFKQDQIEGSRIEGVNHLEKLILVDQAPIGRSPRSNVATYSGVFTGIRKLFAQTEIAKKKGFGPSYFSFNAKGGRCEYCQGDGYQEIEMHLLDNVSIPCVHCEGKKFSDKILQVKFQGVNIVEVLSMSVDYAYDFFHNNLLIQSRLKALKEVGLGYIKLGQVATELSGGEAQRVKLATELAKKTNGNSLYILDEPTIGLHYSDVKQLLGVIKKLISAGNTVLVVEHNEVLIGASDWIIELGPEGGKEGGKIVFEGNMNDFKKADTWTSRIFK